MFDRYSLAATSKQIEDQFSVDVPGRYKPIYNAGPTHLLPVITSHSPEGLSFFYWGAIPEWIKNRNISEKLVNVRAETIPEKTTFRKKLNQYRCLVPIDGFYSWKKVGKKTAIPYRFLLKDKKLMAMAALWEEFEDEEENLHHTFNVITTASMGSVEPINERMPLLLDKNAQQEWLRRDATEKNLLSLLSNKNWDFEFFTVSPRISILGANEATLMLPSAPADQHGNLTLFD